MLFVNQHCLIIKIFMVREKWYSPPSPPCSAALAPRYLTLKTTPLCFLDINNLYYLESPIIPH